MVNFGKAFWRATREILNATAVKLIVAALAAAGFADIHVS